MHCPHCRAVNQQDEERCIRCGRRLGGNAPIPYPIRQGSANTAAATAAALQPIPEEPAPAVREAEEKPEYQASLFRDASGGNKVIPIPTLTPLRPYHRSHREPAPRRAPSRPSAASRNQRRRADSQQSLEFHDAIAEVRVQPGETIVCDAPVAPPPRRLVAAAVDGSLILTAVGVFLAIFFFSGGQVALDRQALSFILGVTVVIALFYRALWCLANGDSPGMRFAGLRLVDFDGKRPDREQRAVRQMASLLSFVSAGLGLVWALVDEENLTWHDHISKTFPTTEVVV